MKYSDNKAFGNGGGNALLRELYSLALIVLVIFVLRSSIFNFYVIPTGSMIPTIKINDRVFANKLSYGLMLPLAETQIFSWATPQRGDIVLFKSPQADTTFVKRVIGVQGDRISFEEGRLVINGKPVQEQERQERDILSDQAPQIQERPLFWESGLGSRPDDGHLMLRGRFSGLTYSNHSTYVVPEGHIFCMGDNRDGSSDSRVWGMVEAKKVYGKALFVLWSTKDPEVDGKDSLLPSLRFERFFHSL
jgi:signal peptidase I